LQEAQPMQALLLIVTHKGQVTIPAEVRRKLGIQKGDKVAIVVEDDHVRIERSGNVVARTAGALRGPEPFRSAEEERATVEQIVANDVVERMNNS